MNLVKKTEKYLEDLKQRWNNNTHLSFEKKLKLILQDYTKTDAFARLVTNTRKRHHISDVKDIIKNNHFTSASLEKIWQQLCAINLHNPSGYLATIKYFLENKVDINSEIQGIKNEAERNPYHQQPSQASTSSKTFIYHAAQAANTSIKTASSFLKPKGNNKSQGSSSGLKYNPKSK